MMSPAGPSISQDVLIDFRYYRFVRHWGKEVLHRIYRKSFRDGQLKPIREILVDNGISLKKFNTQEKNNLENKPSEELDITVLTKLCLFLWEKGVRDPGDTLKRLVKRIKDERNYICHEETNISLTDLPAKIDDFQKVLEDTLSEAESYFRDHGIDALGIDQLQKDIKDDVPRTLEKIREKLDPHSKEDMQKLQQEIMQYWDEFSEFIVERSQKELKANKTLCRIRPFDCLAHYGVTDPSTFNVNLKMDQQEEFHGESKGSSHISVKQRDLLVTDHYGKDPEAVIVSGDAGSGKTTMLLSVVEEWLKGPEEMTDGFEEMTDLRSFPIMLYFQFRDHSHGSLDAYLQHLLPNVTAMFGLENVKASLLRSKCLILCDGYDEANSSSEQLFKEMLHLNFEGKKKVLVTTRPTSTKRLTKIVDAEHIQRLNMSVLGLNSQNMKELIDKITNMLEEDETKRKEIKEELIQAIDEMDESMMAILKTPLYLNYYILLFIKFPDLWKEIRSVTTLYMKLKQHTFERIKEKTELEEEMLDEFDKLYMEWSLPYYRDNKYELSESDLGKLKSKIKSKIESKIMSPKVLEHFDEIMSSYFHVKHKSDIYTSKVFCYKHRSDQEFTVANFICDKIVDSVQKKQENVFANALLSVGIWLNEDDSKPRVKRMKPEILPYDKNGRVLDLIPFIVGMLHSSKDSCYKDALYEVIGDIHNYLLRLDKENEFSFRGSCICRVLIPMSETGSDDEVLRSLVTALKSFPEKSVYVIQEEKSLHPLKLLLPRLSPEHVRGIELGWFGLRKRSLPTLMETISAANRHLIPVDLYLYLDLKELESWKKSLDTTDPALQVVNNLNIRIYDEEDIDLSTLQPPPVTSDHQIIGLNTKRNMKEIPQILNIIFPRSKTDFPKEQQNSESSLPSSGSYLLKMKKHRKLSIEYTGTNIITDDDIRFVLESLDIGPLTDICFIALKTHFEGIKDKGYLRELCKRKGLGKLILTN